MNNKTNKVKWTKKLKALIISVSLAFVVALGGACAAIGLSLSDNNRLGGSFAGGVSDSNTVDIPINEDMIHEITSADQWAEVVAEDSAADGYAVAKLTRNITATSGSFGTAENAYLNGALNVPAGKYIVLDLNGYTLNRGLTEAVEGGAVITNSGNLVVRDTSAKANGKITGGNTTGNGGGIRSNESSTLTIAGGTISNNTATTDGGGIYAITGSTVTITSGTISGNTAVEGGGVYSTGTTTISSGTISNNKANYGGGVYTGIVSTLIMNGGTISDNTANNHGGGIYAAATGEKNEDGSIKTYGITIAGGTISKNEATSNGGGIYSTGTFTISGGTISDNKSVNGGGVYVNGGTFLMTDGLIAQNLAKGINSRGGGFFGGSGAVLKLYGGKISNNRCDEFGGGAFLNGSTVYFGMPANTVDNNEEIVSTFEISNNYAQGGAGIDNGSAAADTIYLHGAKIINNSSGGNTGGIWLGANDSLYFSKGEISGNTAKNGGGINIAGGTLIMSGGTISGNTATQSGGGIYNGGSLTITDGEISNNTANGSGSSSYGGGGVHVAADGSLVVGVEGDETKVPKFENNVTQAYGGGIYAIGRIVMYNGIVNGNRANFGAGICSRTTTFSDEPYKILGGVVSNNTADSNGGGITISANTNLYVEGVEVFNNTTGALGGGIYLGNSTGGKTKIVVNGVNVHDNKSITDGAGLGVNTAGDSSINVTVEVTNSTFDNNSTLSNGGGINLTGSITATLSGNTITNNTAAVSGGGICLNCVTTTITGTTISGNDAVNGGGMYIHSGTVNLSNIKISANSAEGKKENTAGNHGGGVYHNAGSVYFNNEIIIRNNTSSGISDNWYRDNSTAVCIAQTLASTSEIWIGASKETAVIQVPSNTALNCIKVDNPTYWDRTNESRTTPAGSYDVKLSPKTLSGTLASRWQTAVTTSISTGKPQLFELTENWTATAATVQSVSSTQFGTPATGTSDYSGAFTPYGALNVPAGANVVLDLKDKNIDRALTSTKTGGIAIAVYGSLTIKGNGTIKGGYSANGGGVYVYGGTLTLNGGTISGNTANNGGGVYVNGNANFIMNGGTISGNTANNGGGVYVAENCTFIMNGGTIGGSAANKNTANDVAGGVMNYGTFTMNGGTISYNVANSISNGGGGIVSRNGEFTMTGGTISNNTAFNNGGGVMIWGGSHTMTGGMISNNQANEGAGIYVDEGTEFTMSGGTISNNTATRGLAGGVSVKKTATFTMEGGTISGNEAVSGGGVYVSVQATFTMNDGTITGNIGTESGGGIYSNGTVTINGGTISKNSSAYHGGGITDFGTLTITGGNLTGNNSRNGGGVYHDNANTEFLMTGGTISGNTSSSDTADNQFGGGGVHVYSGAFKLTGGEISGNTANTRGGGVYIATAGVFEMSGTAKISGNSATGDAGEGGGVYGSTGSTINLLGGEISGNTSSLYGGGVSLRGSDANAVTTLNIGAKADDGTLSGSVVISGNSSTGFGGGICTGPESYGVMNIYGGKITGNTSGGPGGGFSSAFSINLEGGEISNNTATSAGGGLYFLTTGVLTITGGEISNNSAGGNGGGIYAENTINISGGAISNNTAANGGGVYVGGGSLTMTGGEISGNTSTNADVTTTNVGGGGGVFVASGATFTMGAVSGSGANATYSGDGVISNNTAVQTGGGVVLNGGTFNMYGGSINENIAQDKGAGGVWVQSGTMNMYGGEINENTAEGTNGGGINVYSTFNMYGGTISGNITNGSGGGIASSGTVTISGGTISDNEATGNGGGIYSTAAGVTNASGVITTYGLTINGTVSGNYAPTGGGVYVTGGTLKINSGSISNNRAVYTGGGVYATAGSSIVMEGGEISENTAIINDGAGLYLTQNAKFTLNDGAVSNNKAASLGGGILTFGGIITMNGGEISGNTANIGGGIQHAGGTVTLNAGSITGNIARSASGGIYTEAASINVGSITGKSLIITGNKVDNKENNVNLGNNVKLVIGAALNSDSKIGVTTDSTTYPVVVTSGFGSKNSSNAATVAGNVFKADKEGEVAVYESGEVVIREGYVLTVKDKAGNKLGSISVVAGKTVNGAFDETTRAYTLTQSDASANKMSVVFDTETVPVGYAAYMYDESDPYKAEITSISLSENKSVILDKKALTKNYTIKYILQSVDGSYNETAFVPYTNSGVTDTAVVVMNEEGKPFADIQNAEQYTLDKGYDNGKGVKVAGDGSTVVLVYLQLNEYTVTYNANGGTPTKQTKKFRFGETLSAPTRVPTKKMATFAGWVDSNGKTVLDKDGNIVGTAVTVSANMTLTAKYTVTTYHIRFDMNIDAEDDDDTLNTEYALAFNADDVTAEGTDGYVSWASDKLFEDGTFNFREAELFVFEIDYTIENVAYTMSIKNVRPTAIGYTFAGWYVNGKRTDTIAPPTAATDTDNPIVYKAHWTPTSYAIKFDKQDGTWNAVTNDTVDNVSDLSDLLAKAGTPERGGYRFDGWYMTPSTDTSTKHVTIQGACINTDGMFSIAALGEYGYKTDDGYDFSNLTLYADWVSEDVYIRRTGDSNSSLAYYVYHEDCEDEDGDPYKNGTITVGVNNGVATTALNDPDNSVHIGDLVRVTPSAAPGYRFDHMIIHGANGNVELPSGMYEFTVLTSYITDFENSQTGDVYKVIHVSAEYTEDRYSISYDLNGGKLSGSATYTRSYSPSELTDGNRNRAKLPNNLVRDGYTFLGWVFSNNEANAFVSDADVDTTQSMFGKNLYLVAPTVDNKPVYGNVTLKAKWRAQTATVNLYNATYETTDYDNIEGVEDGYVIKETTSHTALVTDMVIEIINPARTSYDFLGWATSRNGAVVYPAVDGKTTVSYTVSADHDANGKPLNQNNLYAVWHIKGVDRIIMSVDNNECTYGGNGITMTAKTAQVYVAQSGSQISITYKWYRILDGMYDACFTEGNVYIDTVDGKSKVTGYEFDGVYYGANGTTVQANKPAGEAFPYRRFDEQKSVTNSYCVLAKTDTKSQGEASSLNVKNVNDCGTYICAVTVQGVENSGGTTTAGGYGEIGISMKKAVYGNLNLESKEETYVSEALWNAVKLSFVKDDTKVILPQHADDGLLKLPDDSKLIVTYRYYVMEDNVRREITNLNDICNVGTYYVTVDFTWATDGNKGNYADLEAMEAELIIKPFEIQNIGFTFMHGEAQAPAQTFNGVYDGTAYSVIAAINDTFGDDVDGEYVAEEDDVKLSITVNKVNENGVDVPFTGDTIDAGIYSIVISRELTGLDAENYVLKTLNLRQEYTISKSVYDVKGNIRFSDDTIKFDNQEHKIEVEFLNGKTKPETVTPTYKLVDYTPESSGFTSYKPTGNVGKYAGVYTIEVEFADTNSVNYEKLEKMTATLTITKANLFEYFASKPEDAVDLLGEAEFVGRTFKFDPDLEEKGGYKPTVKADSKLANTAFYKITYTYYPVVDGVRGTPIAAGKGFFEAGRYEIVADIEYVSELYKNNFDEVQENESTIVYVIEDVDVESVTVHFTDAFTNSGKPGKLGASFDYAWIRQIDVVYAYKNDDGETVRSTRRINQEDDIKLAQIRYEQPANAGSAATTSFWKVGEFKVYVGVYGSECEVTVNVKQEIDVTDPEVFQIEYNSGNEWKLVGEDGINGIELTGGSYSFRVVYNCIGTDGAATTNTSDATHTALKLGENVLTVGESNSNYIFVGKIAVKMYKVINVNEETLKWQYSENDGSTWQDFKVNSDGEIDYSLPYRGAKYRIRVAFEDNNVPQGCEAHADDNATVLNYRDGGYTMHVGLVGNYLLGNDVFCTVDVTKRVLEVTWDKDTFTYNGMHQAPTGTPTNLASVDKGLITLEYGLFDYDEDAANKKGEPTSEAYVIDADKYVIQAVMHGESSVLDNYTLQDSKTAVKVFTINKANVSVNVTYSEHNYGTNVTYAGNVHGLRTDALRATFSGEEVKGTPVFISGTNPETGEPIVISGDDATIKTAISSAGNTSISYAFIPEETTNYNVTIGQIPMTVKPQAPKRGTGSLLIVLGEGATKHYLVNEAFKTEGIRVYRFYESYYTEGADWYGYRGETPIANPNFRINGSAANGFLIKKEDVSGGMIVLTATSGTDQGTLSIPVEEKKAVELVISSNDYKKEFYVGEAFDYADLEFTVTYDDDTTQEGLKKGSITSDFDNTVFETAGEYEVTFSYFSATRPITIMVKAKEDLQIVEFTEYDKLLVWNNGEPIEAPALKFFIDGTEYTEYDGIKVTRKITQGANELTAIRNVGKYVIQYTVEVTNPRFNKPGRISINVEVTEKQYRVNIVKPEADRLTHVYTGSGIELPAPDKIEVIDAKTGLDVTSTANIHYYIDGVEIINAYGRMKTNAGTYKVKVVVTIGSEETVAEYEFKITQAMNGNLVVTTNTVVLREGANFMFPVTADFGADTVTYEYSTSRNGVFSTEVPTTAGVWYVKVTIAGNANYTELTKIEAFEVRTSGISATVGEGSIEGENGVGSDWTLEIRQMNSEDVSSVSISKQNSLDGYEVIFKAGSVPVKDEGEYTVRIKLTDELNGKKGLNVYFVDANGKATKMSAKVEGEFIAIKMSNFDGRVIITSAQPKESVGLLVTTIVLGVVAAGAIAACIIVFILKKKKRGAQ